MDIRKEVEAIKEEIIGWREEFHQYPEVGMEEYRTAERIKEELNKMNIRWEAVGETGVVGYVGDKSKGKIIALRADIDALRVEEKTGLPFASKNPGVMHACGHDAHIAGLLGAAKVIKSHEEKLKGMVKLIFQPSEENCKGANLMIDNGILDDVVTVITFTVNGNGVNTRLADIIALVKTLSLSAKDVKIVHIYNNVAIIVRCDVSVGIVSISRGNA